MARRLRIQIPGATYHIINRGNYRRDLFETTGSDSHLTTPVPNLDEACTGCRPRSRFGSIVFVQNEASCFSLETC